MTAQAMEVTAPVLRAAGEPMRLERLHLDPPGPGEVRIRMTASGVCHSCLHVADGSSTGRPLPIVLGDEGAGVVDAVGEGCRSLRVGDHVVLSWAPGCGSCKQCLIGRPARCTRPIPFGFADRARTTRFRDQEGHPVHHFGPATYSPWVVVAEAAAVAIREDVPLEVAALIGCSVTTGVGAVLKTSPVAAGEAVAVFGCGGVGLNAVQAARLVGAYPIIAVDVVAAKLGMAEALGATHVVDASRSDPVEQIRGMTSGGVDHAFAATDSAQAIEQAIESTGPGGVCVVIGAPPATRRISLDAITFRAGERSVVGCAYGSSDPAVDFGRMADLYLAGKLRLDELVTRRYGIDEADLAFERLRSGQDARGLIVF